MKKAMNQSKLIAILDSISVLSIILMMFFLFICNNINKQLHAASEDRFNLTYNANRFMDGSAYLTNEVRAYAATGIKTHYDNYMNEVNVLKNRELGVAAMQEIGITASEQAMIDTMSSISNNLVPLEEEAMRNVQNGLIDEAINYVYGDEYKTTVKQIDEIKEQFLSALDVRTKEKVDSLSLRVTIFQILIYVTLIAVIMIQVFVMSVTKRKILSPVLNVCEQMGEFVQGNLSAPFSLEPDTSEIGMLVNSIHETKRELKKYIKDIDSKLAQMAEGRMDLQIDHDYRGDFLPIQNAMRQILDALSTGLCY